MARKGIALPPFLIHEITQDLNHSIGRKIEYPTDCETLSLFILESHGEILSTTSLKRIYGFAKSKHSYSPQTLDSIARVCGASSWDNYCKGKKKVLDEEYEKNTALSTAKLGMPIHTISPEWLTIKQLDTFFHSDSLFFLLSGKSGSGKTTSLLRFKNLQKDNLKYIDLAESRIENLEGIDIATPMLFDNAEVLLEGKHNLSNILGKCIINKIKCVFAIKPETWNAFKSIIVSHYNFRSQFSPLPYDEDSFENIHPLTQADIHFSLKKLNVPTFFDRTTLVFEKVLKHPKLLMEYAAECKETKISSDVHPTIQQLLLVSKVLNRLFYNSQKSFNINELLDAFELNVSSNSVKELISELSKSLDSLPEEASIILAYLCFKENIPVTTTHNPLLFELILVYKYLNNTSNIQEIEFEIKLANKDLKGWYLANAIIYKEGNQYDDILTLPRLSQIVYSHVIDYKTLSEKGENRYSKLLEISNTKTDQAFCLGMLLHRAAFYKDKNSASLWLPIAEELIKEIDECHILAISRLYSGIFMTKFLLNLSIPNYPSSPVVKTFSHFKSNLPFWEMFSMLALNYTKNWEESWRTSKTIDYNALISSQEKSGILKTLFLLKAEAEMQLAIPHQRSLELYEAYNEECFYMKPFNITYEKKVFENKSTLSKSNLPHQNTNTIPAKALRVH